MNKRLFLFHLGLILLALHIYSSGQKLETGTILPKVLCRDEPENSYALFLPSSYTPESEWPILYALDPGARGSIPVELFRQSAEEYNYIIVGSNNSHNGPWQDVIRSLIILWNETNERFSIDKKRIYVAGFSGGSRAASIFSRIIMHPVAGIIGCGAGLAKSLIKPEQIPPATYVGIVGMTDFNYREMMILRDQFEQEEMSHRFLLHGGGHDWPAEKLCQRAIEWMEIIGMQKHLRPLDENLIDRIWEKERDIARSLENAGEISRALRQYKILAETFSQWQETKPMQEKIRAILVDDDYREDARDENWIQEKEMRYLGKFGQVFSQIEKTHPPIVDLEGYTAKLDLEELIDKATDSRLGREHFMAIRLLLGLEIDAGGKGWDLFQKGDISKAIYFFEIALQAGNEDSPRKKSIHYNLACSYARSGNTKMALKNLRLALEHGYDDIDHIKQDEDLAPLRDNVEYQKIIKDHRERSGLRSQFKFQNP